MLREAAATAASKTLAAAEAVRKLSLDALEDAVVEHTVASTSGSGDSGAQLGGGARGGGASVTALALALARLRQLLTAGVSELATKKKLVTTCEVSCAWCIAAWAPPCSLGALVIYAAGRLLAGWNQLTCLCPACLPPPQPCSQSLLKGHLEGRELGPLIMRQLLQVWAL